MILKHSFMSLNIERCSTRTARYQTFEDQNVNKRIRDNTAPSERPNFAAMSRADFPDWLICSSFWSSASVQ